jgi:uncharacterized protein (TIGR04222 family)
MWQILIAEAVLIGVILLGGWVALRRVEAVAAKGPDIRPPDTVDPYEVAFLCGGERSVLVLAVYKLIKKHKLRIVTISAAANRDLKVVVTVDSATIDTGESAIDVAVLEYFREGQSLATALDRFLPQTIHSFCQPYSLYLKSEGYMASNETYRFAGRLRVGAAGAIAAVAALASVWVHPELTPVTISIGLVGLAAVYRLMIARRVTERGQGYLALLRRDPIGSQESAGAVDEAERAAISVCLFGWAYLRDPGDDEFRRLVQSAGAALPIALPV